jgi:hypothetical protein
MESAYRIVNVTAENIHEHPQVICFINPKQESYHYKIDWLQKRFDEGLKIKLIYPGNEKRAAGFIEYVPGEFAWRAVDAAGYLFIHCLWINPDKHKHLGYASRLIDECITEARDQNKPGVAVVCSSGSFMAKSDIFLKNGFSVIETSGIHTLLIKPLMEGPAPCFTDWKSKLAGYNGLSVIYSEQCPWVARFIGELKDDPPPVKIALNMEKLDKPAQAQDAPSVYAVFNLVYNGRLLADHYISRTRFMNILKKEKLLLD